MIRAANDEHLTLQYNADYRKFVCDVLVLDDVEIYCPVGGDQAGYYSYPLTPYRRRLVSLQMRGNLLMDGFRIRSVY